MAKLKIFISHTSTESKMAQVLKKYLLRDFPEALDIFVSSDRATIKAGEKWLDEVSESLKEAQILMVLCSSESLDRPWVNFEAGAGWIREIPVIPICHSGLTLVDLPIPLNLLQAVEVSKKEGWMKLYDGIASVLTWDTAPAANFEEIVSQVKVLEKEYIQDRRGVFRIENPKILCGASAEYSKFGFDLDVAILQDKFPGLVTVKDDLTSRSLVNMLYQEHFDIIHLVLHVDHKNGDLIFSPVGSGFDTNSVDKMSAKRFSSLLVESQTSLVVLATCDALLLAVEVGHIATMVASDTEITYKQAEQWGDWFYGFLVMGKSVYDAYELTKIDNPAPMRLIRKRDLAITLS